MFLRELLEPLHVPVLEDLGALKFVKKQFRPALQLTKQKTVPHDSEHGYITKNVQAGHPRAGQNSKIEVVPLKTGGAVAAEFEKPEVFGAVIGSGNEQLMIVVQTKTRAAKGYGLDTTYKVGIDLKLIDKLMTGDDAATSEMLAKLWKVIVERVGVISKLPPTAGDARLGAYILRGCTKSEVTSLTGTILKALKAEKLPAVLHVLHADVERQELGAKREQARRGVVPRVTDQAFEKEAKAQLKRRLDVFKSSKAVGVDRLEELIAAITEKGYLDKIKIGGYVYDLQDSNIKMDNLKKPDKWNKSYVEYRINSSTAEYQAQREREHQAYKEGPQAYEAFKKTKAPDRVRILLKLQKGAIVPAEIEEED